MKIPCMIMARGGSNRIPRKNIRMFHGKPMIAWSILPAIKSERIDDVFVVTDDDDIASISEDYGAQIIWQPKSMCNYGHWGGPVAHSWFIQHLEEEHYHFDMHITSPSCCPWNTAEDFDGAIRVGLKYCANMVVAVCEWKNATFSYKNSRQDAPAHDWIQRYDDTFEGSIYYHTGNFSAVRKRVLKENTFAGLFDDHGKILPEIVDGTADIMNPKYMVGEKWVPYALPWVVPWYMSFDIDTEENWTINEILFEKYRLVK